MTEEKHQGKKKSHKAQNAGGGGGAVVTFLLVATPAMIFAMPTAVLVIVGMVPSFVAYIIDRDPAKSAGMTVTPINICGILPFTMDMWKHQHTMSAALHLLGDPITVLVMYGAAAVGWALYFIIPPIVSNFEVLRAQSRIETLIAKKAELIEEWGPDVGISDEELHQKLKPAVKESAAAKAES